MGWLMAFPEVVWRRVANGGGGRHVWSLTSGMTPLDAFRRQVLWRRMLCVPQIPRGIVHEERKRRSRQEKGNQRKKLLGGKTPSNGT